MKRKEKIEEETVRTLQCLEHMDKLEGGPYFYSRVLARINRLEHRASPSFFNLFAQKLWRPAFLTFLIVINLFTAIYAIVVTQSQGNEKKTYMTAIAEDYSINQGIYELYLTKAERRGNNEAI